MATPCVPELTIPSAQLDIPGPPRRCKPNLGSPARNVGARSRFAVNTALLTVASIDPAIGGVMVFRKAVPLSAPWLRGPAVALVVAAGLWGLAVSGTKYALGGFDPVTLLSVELVAGAGVLWAALLARGYRPPRSWWLPAVLGLLEPALAYLGDTFGLSLTSAVHGAVINGLESGLVVLLAAVLLREAVTRPAILAIVVALGGLAVLAGVGTGMGGGTAAGDLLVAGGVLSASLYTIVAKRFDDGSDALSLTAWQFTVAAIMSLLVTIARWATGSGSMTVSAAPRFWLVAVLVGTGGFGLSFLLFNMVIVQVDAGRAAVVLNLIPVFGVASAVVFLGEVMTGRDALGAVLIGSSVVYFAIAEHRGVTAQAPSAGLGCSAAGRWPPPDRQAREHGGGQRGDGQGQVDGGEAVHWLMIARQREVGGSERGGAQHTAGPGDGVEQATEVRGMPAGH
jgi:O-acetylserine/cysteine efflux transporter